MSRRRLRPDELALWHEVAKTAQPLDRARPAPPRDDAPKRSAPAPRRSQTQERPAPSPFRIGQSASGGSGAHDLAPSLSDRVKSEPLRMDRKTHQRMKRGRLDPEARIDLHGMRADEAHAALQSFILSAQAQGRRLVLVITGKGRRSEDEGPIPRRPGVLRHQLPHWLSTPPLASCVLQIREAHLKHGGAGAFYVYLRRRR
jgi:DNA-nicking Smr family endonuclease